MEKEFLSTRLFPKNQGADAYQLTGIAARCDWVVLSDFIDPQCCVKKRVNGRPKTVFLSLRNLRAVLPYFVQYVLPQLKTPFVLVSGSEDVTLPNQLDKRWAAIDNVERQLINDILRTPTLVKWFAENLDEKISYKLTPLPLGMVYPDSRPTSIIDEPISKLSQRPLHVLCSHRVREGEQWQQRREITKLAASYWSEFTTVLTEEVEELEFIEHLKQHSFVICAQGGGIDPSPKAWQALYYGAIPIIKTSALDDAYDKLPVVKVDDWLMDTLTLERLEHWRDMYAYHFDTIEGRQQLLKKLTLDYWWEKIVECCLADSDL